MKNGSEVISCTVRSYCELHQSKYDSNRCFKLKVASCQLRSIDTAPWKNGLSKILNVSTHFLWPERHWLCIESEISVLLLLKSEFIVVWVFMFDYRTLFESPRLLPSVNWSWVRYLQKYFHDFICNFIWMSQHSCYTKLSRLRGIIYFPPSAHFVAWEWVHVQYMKLSAFSKKNGCNFCSC